MENFIKFLAQGLAFIAPGTFRLLEVLLYLASIPFTINIFISALILRLIKRVRDHITNHCMNLNKQIFGYEDDKLQQFVGGIIAGLVIFGLPIAAYIYKTGGL